MNISDNGLDFIKKHEGLRLKVYIDAVGMPTVGYGHADKELKVGSAITQEIADHLLEIDCAVAENCINDKVTVPLNQNQFDALCSFIFNVGCWNFQTSTLSRLLNMGEYGKATLQFLRWNKGRVNGKMVELPGLTIRRKDEKELFEKPT
jgi:lysozyme